MHLMSINRPAKCDWCLEEQRSVIADTNIIDTLTGLNVITDDMATRFCRHQISAALSHREIIHCPVSTCQAAALKPANKSLTRAERWECKTFYCYECSVTWHTGMTCKVY